MVAKLLVACVAAGTILFATQTPARAGCRSTTEPSSPQGADGCPLGGRPLYWKAACIGWALSQDTGSQIDIGGATAVIAQSFATWSGVSCGGVPPSIEFIPLGTTPVSAAEYVLQGSNVNLIVFRDDDWPHDGGNHDVALTTVTYESHTGEILDADMEINSANFDLTTDPAAPATDLQSVITHEAGHFLGFAHSSDADATMAASYLPGTIDFRDLAPDDVELICQTYLPDGTRPTNDGVVVADACQLGGGTGSGGGGDPDDGSSGDCPTTTVASCAAAPGSAAPPITAMVLMGLAIAGARLRRRKR